MASEANCITMLCIMCLTLFGGSSCIKEIEWWQTTTVYQIYPRSFKDSDGDGIGDLKGIIEKLDHVAETGFEVIWIQPVYKSPMRDMGYDVSDYRQIDPLFGDLKDFQNFIEESHKRGMKVVADFVPNHVSIDHEWFKKSERREDPYTDYFIWKDAKRVNDTHTTYPNNWQSTFGGSAWEWSEKRKQYYYRRFSVQQPDLDLRNPNVQEELNNVLRYWMDIGVDGFRVDAVLFMVEASHFLDEPIPNCYTVDQPENVDVVYRFRKTIDDYSKKDGYQRLLTLESWKSSMPLMRAFMGNTTHKGAHTPFYFGMVFYDYEQNAKALDGIIRTWADSLLGSGFLPNWMISSHDEPRAASRLSPEAAGAITMVQLLLPGLASVLYGDELGLEDITLRRDQRRDPLNLDGLGKYQRDGAREPMIWDDTRNGGFTNGTPWLPINPGYWQKNVKSQLKAPKSHLKLFKRLMALRKTKVFRYGDLESYVTSEWAYMFTRSLENESPIAVLVNFGSDSSEICMHRFAPKLPEALTVHTASLNSGYEDGDKVGKCVELRPKAGLVLMASHGVALTSSICLIFIALFASFFHFAQQTAS